MRPQWMVQACRTLAVILLVLARVALTAAPTQAATALTPSSSDTLTLALSNGTSFVYAGQPGGTPAPRFTATLVLAAKPTANYWMQVIVSVGSQTFANSSAPTTQDQLTYTFDINSAGIIIPAGSQTASASFYNASTKTTAYSNAVAFTIARATPQPQCTIDNYTFINDPGQTLRFSMSFNGDNPNAPVDWQNATYQITFYGTTNNTFPSGTLSPDSQDSVTVQTPTQFDWYYRIDCTFNGTANFAPATTQAASQPILVSAKHPLGKVDFTSVPWPLVAYQTAQVHIVVHATPGGRVPNGFVSIRIGQIFTPFHRLDATGEIAGTLQALGPGNLVGPPVLYVDYQGDPYYDAGSAGFPMTSGSGGSGGNGGGSGGSQPTATPARTPGAAGTPTAQASPGTSGLLTSVSQGHNAGGTGLPWWLVLLGVLVLVGGGGIGSWLYLSRRAARTLAFSLGRHTDSDGRGPSPLPVSSIDDTKAQQGERTVERLS